MTVDEPHPSPDAPPGFDADVAAHDARLAARGLTIWVGSEPTFTDRWEHTPEWLQAPLGDGKLERAHAYLRAFQAHFPGGLVLRPEGRRYPGEEQPRWCFAVLRRRDDTPLWSGPPDPITAGDPAGPSAARDGDGAAAVPSLELPDFGDDVAAFLQALADAEARARAEGWTRLVFTGALPPCNGDLALTTITPDPAVIEVNAAPSLDARDFLQRSRRIYAAAQAVGLAPYRLHFNGVVADSGGGGQITLGGPTADDSPFVREPRLLPRLVRFFNHHPALTYLFCHDFVGAGGQSVRSDERGQDAFDELRLALALIDRLPQPTAEQVWQALAPFLSDAAGNNHRAELNVEKLRSPYGGPRGRLGLVEFRALRMQHSPERATAIACLLRAIVAMLAQQPFEVPLIDWGRELHDRFALPHHLEQDLADVFAALEDAGFGLGPSLIDVLRRDEFRHLADLVLPGATLEIRRALEFWPLLGDTASPEQGGSSRLIDASTSRIELRLRAHDADGARWRLSAAGQPLPLRDLCDCDGPLRVAGLRWRAYAPRLGLHPSLPTQAPVTLRLDHPERAESLEVTLHEWHPDGGAYPGLPEHRDEAARRRAERVTCTACPASSDSSLAAPTADASAGAPIESPSFTWTLDLRWVTGAG